MIICYHMLMASSNHLGAHAFTRGDCVGSTRGMPWQDLPSWAKPQSFRYSPCKWSKGLISCNYSFAEHPRVGPDIDRALARAYCIHWNSDMLNFDLSSQGGLNKGDSILMHVGWDGSGCSYPYDEGSFVHLWDEVPPTESHDIFGGFQVPVQ